MLHNHINHFNTHIHQCQQLVLGLLRGMAYSYHCSQILRSGLIHIIPLQAGRNLFATCSQHGHILHNYLAAYL